MPIKSAISCCLMPRCSRNVLILAPKPIKIGIDTAKVVHPNGTETQRVGILPDIEMRPTIRGIKEGKDELLERAIEFINQN